MATNVCPNCQSPRHYPEGDSGHKFRCVDCKHEWETYRLMVGGVPIEDVAKRRLGDIPKVYDRELLEQRGSTHGDYMAMCATIQAIKDVMHGSSKWHVLHTSHKEALELIATKVGRILNGDPLHDDHWADIAGYATKGREIATKLRG